MNKIKRIKHYFDRSFLSENFGSSYISESIGNFHWNESSNIYTYFGNYGKKVDIKILDNSVSYKFYFGIFFEKLVYEFTTTLDYPIYTLLTEMKQNHTFRNEFIDDFVKKLIISNAFMFLSNSQIKFIANDFNHLNAFSFERTYSRYSKIDKAYLQSFKVNFFGFLNSSDYLPSEQTKSYFISSENNELYCVYDYLVNPKFKELVEAEKLLDSKFFIAASKESKNWYTIKDVSGGYAKLTFKNDVYIYELYIEDKNKVQKFISKDKEFAIYSFIIDVLKLNKNMLNIKVLEQFESVNFEINDLTIDDYKTFIMYTY